VIHDSLSVVSLDDGSRDERDLLGGKGANLAELRKMGLRVPPAFVITTRAYRSFAEHDGIGRALADEIRQAVERLGQQCGKGFDDTESPLLVSVRSGAPISMPGMMDTILNVGLTRSTFHGFASGLQDPEAAIDCYRRLLHMYAGAVHGAELDPPSSPGIGATAIADLRRQFADAVGTPFPDDAMEQLMSSVSAVFGSWNSARAKLYRKFHGIPDTGTAVVVQAMVFGNTGPRSGTGVVFTRDPATGDRQLFGEYLASAQGEDIVAGTHTADEIDVLRSTLPEVHAELMRAARAVEERFRDMCELEFTVQNGELWLLQSRSGQRSAAAAVRIAVQLADDGLIDRLDAIDRIDLAAVARLLRPRLDADRIDSESILTTGIGSSPGLGTGRLVVDPRRATEQAEQGDAVVLVRPETRPEDLEGILACTALLTLRGGKTSHAAVVARGLGRPCVCGVEGAVLDLDTRTLRVGERVAREGDVISVDGDGGMVIRGPAPATATAFPAEATRLLEWCDERRDLRIEAIVGSVPDAARAIAAGADGLILRLASGPRQLNAVNQWMRGATSNTALSVWITAAAESAADWFGDVPDEVSSVIGTPDVLAALDGLDTRGVPSLRLDPISPQLTADPGFVYWEALSELPSDPPEALHGRLIDGRVFAGDVSPLTLRWTRALGATTIVVGVEQVVLARLATAQTISS
jgi:pyruvate,orthophosphate dikinase